MIVTDVSEDIENIGKSIVWMGEDEVVTSQQCLITTPDYNKLDGAYLAYFFNSNNFLRQKRRFTYGSSIFHIYARDIEKCLIPLPPLRIQQAIGQFLYQIEETFSSPTFGIKKEIELRQQLFGFLLEQIINSQNAKCIKLSDGNIFLESEDTSPNYTITKLNDICFSISIGTYLTKKIKEDSKRPPEELIYPVYGSTGIVRYGSSYLFDGTKILVSCIGHTGIVHLAHGKFDVNQNSLIIDLDESKCDFNYLYYYLKTCKLDRLANGGAQKCLTATSVRNVEIKLPPIEQQRNIGKFFSTFDSYINNLEKELSLREQQFKFYLDKLFDQL